MIGRTLSHYEILDQLGAGGMGVLYRAVDTRLGRTVAIKVLRPDAIADPERRRRLEQEARAASALNHPNIVTIYEIDRAGSGEQARDFIAMEYVEGESLDRRIQPGGLPVADAVAHAAQIAAALGAAHAAGIVHRDIKPGNVMVTRDGRIKVLDFGLAKLDPATGADSLAPTVESPPVTWQGAILGTPVYMSPEQAEGKPVDARSDVFSLGLVLYEMLTGQRPFAGNSQVAVLAALLAKPVPAVRSVRAEVPGDVARIVDRCLAKDPQGRYPTAGELARDLAACQARLAAAGLSWRSLLRPRVAVPTAAVLLAALGLGAWVWTRTSRRDWARSEALPEIERLIGEDRLFDAWRLAQRVERILPGDARLAGLWQRFTLPVTVRTEPSGAAVSVQEYLAPETPWEPLGPTPVEWVRLPDGIARLRIALPAFETIEAAPLGSLGEQGLELSFTLLPEGTSPPGMVRVPGGPYRFRGADAHQLDAFWIDRTEVTNRQFKEFVDAGGYERPEPWREPFVRDGATLGREEARSQFRDATGRPGPATWELGSFPEGEDEFPVRGVSWYEAAAYAAWAGKALPTLHHWFKAAEPHAFSEIVLLSNLDGSGPAAVASHAGLGPHGTLDMAGNVQEWSSSATGTRRYILGGAWSQPTYLYAQPEAVDPFRRDETFGFRCVRYDRPPAAEQVAPVERTYRDYGRATPVSDEVFAALTSVYAYDRTPLDARVEGVDDDASPHWRLEQVSFAAAYDGERVPAYLLLPRNAAPPYQTVVYFPTSLAEGLRRSRDHLELRWIDFIVRSGRAVLYPVYKGTYERVVAGGPSLDSVRRDLVVQWSKDVGRSLDYLETRPDLDRDRVAFYGFSLGAVYGPLLTAMEPRFRAAIVLGGGLPNRALPPEADVLNFAPRVRMPFLVLAGRDDFLRPVEASQQPLVEILGTPAENKRLALFDGGHVPPKLQGVIKEILDWLDRYLGPVQTGA